jgi:hypothetical protein
MIIDGKCYIVFILTIFFQLLFSFMKSREKLQKYNSIYNTSIFDKIKEDK